MSKAGLSIFTKLVNSLVAGYLAKQDFSCGYDPCELPDGSSTIDSELSPWPQGISFSFPLTYRSGAILLFKEYS